MPNEETILDEFIYDESTDIEVTGKLPNDQ